MKCTYIDDHIEMEKNSWNEQKTKLLNEGIFPCPNYSCNMCVKPKHNLLLQIRHLMAEEVIKTICMLTKDQLWNYDKTYFLLKKANVLEALISELSQITSSKEIKTLDHINFYNIDTVPEGQKVIEIILTLLVKDENLVTPITLTRISMCKSNKLKIIFKKFMRKYNMYCDPLFT